MDSISKAKRNVGPDLLRAFAILLVMTWHLPKAGLPEGMLAIKKFGWLGVDIFFVLSGFLIGSEIFRQVRDRASVDLKVFYAKRALRILPVFWIILLVYVLWPDGRESPDLAPVWRFLTFTVNFGLDYRATGAFTHAWSLCVEEHFYLFLPMVTLFFLRIRSVWVCVGLALLILIGGMILRATIWQQWHVSGEGAAPLLKDLYYPTYTHLDGLLMGVLLALVHVFRPNAWQRYGRFRITFPAGLVCLALCFYINPENSVTLTAISAPVFYPLFSLGVALWLSSVLRIEGGLQPLRWTGATFIAEISYSLYLSHKLVMHTVRDMAPKAWTSGWSVVALYYVASIAVAVVLFFAIERTFLKLRPRILHLISQQKTRRHE